MLSNRLSGLFASILAVAVVWAMAPDRFGLVDLVWLAAGALSVLGLVGAIRLLIAHSRSQD